MDLRLLPGIDNFAMGSVVAFIYGTALFSSTYLLPVCWGWSCRRKPWARQFLYYVT